MLQVNFEGLDTSLLVLVTFDLWDMIENYYKIMTRNSVYNIGTTTKSNLTPLRISSFAWLIIGSNNTAGWAVS